MNNSKYSPYVMTVVMLTIFSVMVGISMTYPPGARFMVLVVGIPAIALCLLQILLDLRASRADVLQAEMPQTAASGPMPEMPVFDDPTRVEHSPETARKEMILWGYWLSFMAGILLFGFYIAVPVFLFTFLHFFAHASWQRAAILTGMAWTVMYLVFEYVFRMGLFGGFVTEFITDRISG